MNTEKFTIETVDCVSAIYKGDVDIHYCCPHCGESYYMEKFSTSTCVYYPPIYKDGVNINPDRNTITAHCTCLACGKDFCVTK